MKSVIWLLFIALCFYNAVDVWQTHLLLIAGAEEMNPLYSWIGEHKMWAIGAVKIVLLTTLGLTLGALLRGNTAAEQS